MVLAGRRFVPAPRPAILLACALPKGDRQAVMWGMAVQLGIATFTPLRCEHSVNKPGPGARRRFQRIAIEHAKQSRQPYVPRLCEAASPVNVLEWAMGNGDTVLFADPAGGAARAAMARAGDNRVVMVGPEGGWSAPERDALRTGGAQGIQLGPGVLRVETAAVVAVALARLG